MWAKHKQAGFTIVELLIVIVVIGILAAISIVAYTGISQRAVMASLQSDLTNASNKLKLYQIDNSTYPTLANDCPAPAAGNICLKSSPGNTYNYVPNNTTSPQSFNLTATHDSQLYTITQDGVAVVGGRNLLSNSSIEKTGVNEFLQYADLAPIFDSWGMRQYTISFDIKSANVSTVSTSVVYMQNGSGARYDFNWLNVPVTTSYTRQSVTVIPTLPNPGLVQSMLAFYGSYGSGNIITVKNVKVEFGSIATTWTPGP